MSGPPLNRESPRDRDARLGATLRQLFDGLPLNGDRLDMARDLLIEVLFDLDARDVYEELLDHLTGPRHKAPSDELVSRLLAEGIAAAAPDELARVLSHPLAVETLGEQICEAESPHRTWIDAMAKQPLNPQDFAAVERAYRTAESRLVQKSFDAPPHLYSGDHSDADAASFELLSGVNDPVWAAVLEGAPLSGDAVLRAVEAGLRRAPGFPKTNVALVRIHRAGTIAEHSYEGVLVYWSSGIGSSTSEIVDGEFRDVHVPPPPGDAAACKRLSTAIERTLRRLSDITDPSSVLGMKAGRVLLRGQDVGRWRTHTMPSLPKQLSVPAVAVHFYVVITEIGDEQRMSGSTSLRKVLDHVVDIDEFGGVLLESLGAAPGPLPGVPTGSS